MFFIDTFNNTTKVGIQVKLIFQLTQHSRDTLLMESLIKYLNCGILSNRSSTPAVDFKVTRFSDINDKIIPFFNKYQIKGVKLLDFKDLCKAAEIIKTKAHLTEKGSDQFIKIKAGMNKGRS